jgi:hypothetical protein
MKLYEHLGRTPILRAEENKASPFPTTDPLGIEVELENITLDRSGARIPLINPPSGWIYHSDESLRNNGLEFVFQNPVGGTMAAKRLDSLITWIKDNKQKPDASSRTSVHIHIDAGDCTTEELLKWLIIYTVYESLLFAVFAPDRKDSNFCVPVYASSDTRKLIGLLKRSFAIFYKDLTKLRGTRRYSAVNLDALQKFASLEFRHLSGTYKPKPIIDWVCTLLYLKMWAMNENTNISEIFHGPSKFYCQQMTSAIFSEEIANKFLSHKDFTELYLAGVRTAQEIFLDEKIPEIPDEFLPRLEEGRKKKYAKKIESLKAQLDIMRVVDTNGEFVTEAPNRGWLPPPVEAIPPEERTLAQILNAQILNIYSEDTSPQGPQEIRPRAPRPIRNPRRFTVANPTAFHWARNVHDDRVQPQPNRPEQPPVRIEPAARDFEETPEVRAERLRLEDEMFHQEFYNIIGHSEEELS